MWETFYKAWKRKKEPSYKIMLLEETLKENKQFEREVKKHFDEIMDPIPRLLYQNLFFVLSRIPKIESKIESYFFENFPFRELDFSYSLIQQLQNLFPNASFSILVQLFEKDLANCSKYGDIVAIDALLEYHSVELSESNTIALLKSKVDVCCKKKDKTVYHEMIDVLIEDMKRCARENNQDDTVSYLTHGYYSYAVRCGDLVLKVGEARNTKDDFKTSQKAFTYANFNYEEDNICLQLMDYVDNYDLTEEDVYLVYKRLRDESIIWTDTKVSNIGIQSENRKRVFPLPNHKAKEMLQITHECEESEVIVLRDVDYLYHCDRENTQLIMYRILTKDFQISHTYDYEMRYQLEKEGIVFLNFDEYDSYFKEISVEKVLSLHKKSLTNIR